MKQELIIALDNMSMDAAIELAQKLEGKVWGFKINDLLLAEGVAAVKNLLPFGKVFADPKLHDIPNTVFNCVSRLTDAGASIITVHVSGGREMLQYAHNGAFVNSSSERPVIAGVTTLTSLTNDDIRELYRGFPIQKFIDTILKARLTTVVCAPAEAEFYSSFNLKTICPGFRPFGPLPCDDQKRPSCQPKADYLVIGRPVTQHKNPVEAVERIKEKMKL